MQDIHVLKLVKKEFGITSYKDIHTAISSKPEEYYHNNFFTDKTSYLKRVSDLIDLVNEQGEGYSIALEESKWDSISIMQNYAHANLYGIRMEYAKNRKLLVNHLRFFIDPSKRKKTKT